MRSEGIPNFFCVTEHRRDAARAEESVVLSYGTELIGMQRDWNEELQSCREFPHGNPQERFFSYSNYCPLWITWFIAVATYFLCQLQDIAWQSSLQSNM